MFANGELTRDLPGSLTRIADRNRCPESLLSFYDRVADDVRQGRRLEYKSRRKVGLTFWGHGGRRGRGLWARLRVGPGAKKGF